ncbi:uncharacterized protein LOC100678309 isoform X1 [Nasonia vitripennis]|uniref:DNA/RNA non-specific endonuclease/pyrophosphatase/phosphodiesterase domain-containing protein n=1 Tax=Nasonia vitripennis TaxID=7425 RepID=A0A7M7H848_NASVI|nr:uncharacterized protein LOC100678309 isoform X1 [Nasonia vitripennis]
MEHLSMKRAIVLVLFIIVSHTSNSIKVDKSKFDAIKKSRSVKTSMQSKRFGKSIIVPPIPPVPPMPFILTEERIKESYHDKSSKLMNKFKRKQNLPTRLGTTSTIIFPSTISQATTTTLRPITTTQQVITTILETSTTTQRSITSPSIEIPPIIYPQITTTSLRPATTTLILGTSTTTQRSITSPSIEIPPIIYPQITTTTLRPIITTQLAAPTSTLYPLTTTERDLALGSDSDGFGKLIVGLLTAGTLVLFVYYLLWQITFTVPFILFVPKFPVGGPPPRLPGTLKPPTNRTPKPSDNDDGDKSDDSDEEDEDCEKSKDKKSKDECEKKKKKRNPCKINIKKISDDYPLIIQHTDHSKFLYPQSKGKIVLQPDDKITFGCNSADTYSCKNITIIENVVSYAESTISSMSCSLSAAKIHSKIQFLQGYFGKKSQYQKFQIGLSYGRNFVPTITGYYNAALESTAFVRSTLSSAIGYKQKKPPQRELQQDLLAWSPDVYSLSSQQDTFSQLLLCHGNSTHKGDCSYVNRGSYLEPALLTPASHFVYTRAAATAHYYMNSAPMWNTIKYGNWDKIEKHVQRMASSLKKDLIVITGVYGQLRLPDYGGLYKDIFMETDYDECSKSIVVPQYFWKLVYDPASVNGKPSGIVYVTVNNPFMDSKNYYKICQNPGQSVNGESPAWWKPNSFKSGFSYVCAVDDFILTTRLDLVDRLS